MKENKQSRWLMLLPAILGALIWSVSPLINFGSAAASEAVPSPLTTYLQASLTGTAISNVTPFGRADYKVFSSGARRLTVSAYSVNLPAGTSLQVSVNNVAVGNIVLSSQRSGVLDLNTESSGGTVPTPQSGQTVTIKNGATTILSGTFAAVATPTPTGTRTPSGSPSPSATRTPFPTPVPPLFAPLTGAVISGAAPSGLAVYETGFSNQASDRELEIYITNVNLAAGTQLTVFVGATQVGQFNLDSNGRGRFEIRSATLPTIAAGTQITIKNGTTTILSGTFTNTAPTPTPRPSVSPTASPTGSPTPRPTPGPARVFEARLSGGQVVPAVTTNARGEARILLSADETQIQVFAAFFNLSSNQTKATINGSALPGATAATIFDLGTVGGTSGFIPVRTFTVTAAQVAALRAGTWYIQIGSVNNPNGEIRGQIRAAQHRGDFDGDRLSDVSVFRPTTGNWYFLNSSDGAFRAKSFGSATDKAVAGDYDGDGVSDPAIFTAQGNFGVWKISRSSDEGTTTEQWGLASDTPVNGDFDGDGRNDLAVFRAAEGNWYVKRSSDNSYFGMHWGANGDLPVAADFDGDGRDDVAVFRPSTGDWFIYRSSDSQMQAARWGVSTDIPVAGDFDGDGAADVAVFRPSNGVWFILQSVNNEMKAVQFGTNGDVPVAGEFDGDGVTDFAVFRATNGFWYILKSEDNSFSAVQFGTNGDRPSFVN